jgi:hypothetical protein
VANALKVALCPEDSPDCDHCAHGGQEGAEARDAPCAAIGGVTDQLLFSKTLREGERSAVFGSRSSILERYGGHRICFCYVHVGTEIARLEFPVWVADDRKRLDLLHACAYDQAQKGGGYPVTLAEAHQQAVVRAQDREAFYAMLKDAWVSHELGARVSRKQLGKRSMSV